MQKTLIASVLVSSFVHAQDEMPPAGLTNEERMAARAEVVHGRLGFDFASQYYFRGIQQENQGIIFQPWIDLNFDLLKNEEGLQDLKVVIGQWNSLHDGPTGGSGGIWYESRFYLGVEGKIADRWHVGTRYNTYTSPNGTGLVASGTRPVQELAFYGRFDDVGVFSDSFSLQPTALIAFELSGQRDGGNDRGIYVELGVSPSIEIGQLGESPITFSVPAKIGLSLRDYYERLVVGGNNDFLGFGQIGGVVSAPLDFMPARLGPWVANAGVHLIVLGTNNRVANSGDTAEVFFTFGMSTTF